MNPLMNEHFKRLQELKQELLKCTIKEQQIIKKCKLDLGDNPKNRLTYLARLGAIPYPETIYLGKAKGGGRLFHPDTIEILEYLNSFRSDFSLAVRVKLLQEERDRREKSILENKKILLENKPPEKIIYNDLLSCSLKNWDNEPKAKSFFSKRSIKKALMIIHLGILMTRDLNVDIGLQAINSLYVTVANNFCPADKVKVEDFYKYTLLLKDSMEKAILEIFLELEKT